MPCLHAFLAYVPGGFGLGRDPVQCSGFGGKICNLAQQNVPK